MIKLMTSPVFHLDEFQNLYTPDEDVIFYKMGPSISYSFPTHELAIKAMGYFSKIIFNNGLHLSQTLTSGFQNHIITLKIRK